MKRLSLCAGLLGLALALAAPAARGEATAVKTFATGTPQVKSIDVIRFGPNGLLLVGDGRGAQILAVETGDTQPKPALKAAVEKIGEKLGGRLGTTAKGIEIVDLAVNPASHVTYFAVRKQDDKRSLILTVDGDGKIGEFALENVKYARLALPAGEKAAVSRITDLAWAGSRVVAAAQANEEFACKIYSANTPLEHDAKATVYSAETYHVSHKRWETKAPMSSLLPFEENGKAYVAGAFACTPVVKYPLDDLQPGAKVKGSSVIELGSGNRPLHMFTYEKDGRSYVLMNTFRFHHAQRPFGPSPYWTVRIESDLLRENQKVNEQALHRLGQGSKPVTDKIKMVDEYHGVVHLALLDGDHALAVREDGQGGLTLTPLALP